MTISRRKAIRLSGAAALGLSFGHVLGCDGTSTRALNGSRTAAAGGSSANGSGDPLSRQLARFVVQTNFEDLPKPIVDSWKLIILDSLALGFLGSRDRLAGAMNTVARRLGGAPECTVINQSYRTDVSRAAWVNGTLIGTPQADSPSNSHAASNVVPAIMAIAEHQHLSGKAFLAALILGGEVGGRIQRTSVGVEGERGFHNPGVQGPFSAAAAVGKLLGFDENTMVHALGIAGSSSAGLQEFAFEGADMKATHAGRAAQLGLESALLAGAGVLGPSTVLEGPFGYFKAFSLPTDVHKVVANLGVSSLRLPIHKHYTVHSSHQQVVDTIVRFKAARPSFNAANVKRVTIRAPEGALRARHLALAPTTIMGAKYSMPFTTSVALFRDLTDPLNYDDAAVNDPKIRSLAKRIELVAADDVGDRANGGTCEVTIAMTDGHRYVLPSRAVKGSGRDRYTWDDGAEKFRRWTRRIIDDKQTKTLLDAVRGLDEIPDMAVVVRTMAARG